MSQMFEDIKGVEVVVDDILVWGENKQQHDTTSVQVLERARHRNLTLDKIKCQMKRQHVAYLGHILTSQGLQPDPKNMQPVTDIPPPQDKKALQLFRFVNLSLKIYSKSLPNSITTQSTTGERLNMGVAHKYEDRFLKLKQLATTAPVLKYFKPDRPIKLSVDANSKGLVAVLIQDEHPIAYASKSLSSTQQNYA